MIDPPPSPDRARATINLQSAFCPNGQTHHVTFLAAPHRAEKTKRNRIARLRAGFLPVMSVNLPLIGVMMVCASRYEVAIQEYSDGLALSSVAMVGRAVEMIYLSALVSKVPYRLIQSSHE